MCVKGKRGLYYHYTIYTINIIRTIPTVLPVPSVTAITFCLLHVDENMPILVTTVLMVD